MLHLHQGPDKGHTSDRIEKRKKPSTRQNSNPQPLCHEACAPPLCYNRCLIEEKLKQTCGSTCRIFLTTFFWFSPFLRTMGRMETLNSWSISNADRKLWIGSNSWGQKVKLWMSTIAKTSEASSFWKSQAGLESCQLVTWLTIVD